MQVIAKAALAASVLAVVAAAQSDATTISPVVTATLEGNSNNAFPFNSAVLRRYMQIHGDVSSVPITISQLNFRVNASSVNYLGTKTFDMELFMGHGNAGSVTNPSYTYANNYFGAPTAVVVRANIVIGPTGQATTPGPNPFTMPIPITPFAYAGTSPLIWEAVVYGVTSVGTTSQLDADASSLTSGVSTITGVGCLASTQATTLMTHGVTAADVGGTFHFGVTVTAGPNNAPCVLAIGSTNPNLPVPGLCTNLLTDLTAIVAYGTTSATGAITNDTLPFQITAPNTFGGATITTQVHAFDIGRADPILICNSNGRSTVLPAPNLTRVNAVTRLWNNAGGTTATQAFFATSTVGYGLVTEFTY